MPSEFDISAQSTALTLMLIHYLINALREAADVMKLRHKLLPSRWLRLAWMVAFPVLALAWITLSCSPLIYYGLEFVHAHLH